MTNLERKKLEVAIKKAEASKAELELKIEERLEDIERMKHHITLQNDVINSSKEKLEV